MEIVGVGEWFVLMLLFSIPIVNLIAIIVFACGVGKSTIVNFARATVLWFLVGLGIVFAWAAVMAV